jgi:hypothetical protein
MKNVVAALVTSLAMVSLGIPTPSPAQDSTVDMTAKPRKTAAGPRRMDAEVLALEPGDRVLVTYVLVNDQLQAQRIVKAPEARQSQQVPTQ